jgi:feruloyl esterase
MAVEQSAELIAMDPDISAYIKGGGKLITFHGSTDGLISYGNSVNYFERMLTTLGEDTVNEGARFYLVPGMDHCAGGEGAHAIDWLSALEGWVEDGVDPGTLEGTHPVPQPGFPGSENATEFTRPICAYPEVAGYDGSGDPDDAASFICAAPQGAVPERTAE